jgi:tetratricopeptide (TPR) repeat protein
VGEEHPLRATAIYNLASVLHAQDEYDEARRLYDDALERRRRLLGPENPETLYVVDNLGRLLTDLDEPAQAEPLFREALAGLERVFGPDHSQVAAVRLNLGVVLVKLEQYAEAESELLAAEKVLGTAPGLSPSRRRRLYETLIGLYDAWNLAKPGQGYDAKAQPWREKRPAAASEAEAPGDPTSPDEASEGTPDN